MAPQPQGRILEIIDFDCVYVDEDRQLLIATGSVPYSGGTVMLEPHVYLTAPDYWGVDLVWDRTEAIIAEAASFRVSIPLAEVSGLRGVMLYGRRKTLMLTLNEAEALSLAATG